MHIVSIPPHTPMVRLWLRVYGIDLELDCISREMFHTSSSVSSVLHLFCLKEQESSEILI